MESDVVRKQERNAIATRRHFLTLCMIFDDNTEFERIELKLTDQTVTAMHGGVN